MRDSRLVGQAYTQTLSDIGVALLPATSLQVDRNYLTSEPLLLCFKPYLLGLRSRLPQVSLEPSVESNKLNNT